MADTRSNPSQRSTGIHRGAWSLRARKPLGALACEFESLAVPREDLKTAEWRVLGMVEELNLRIDRFSQQVPDDLSLLVQIVATLVQEGLETGARSLHFEPGSTHLRIRARSVGELREKVQLPLSLHQPLIEVLRRAAELEAGETRRLNDGLLRVTLGNRQLELRLTCLPSAWGETAILHLPPPSSSPLVHGLSGLGLFPDTLAVMDAALSRTGGLILVAAPAGSDRAQILYSLIHRISERSQLTISLEDPVECLIPGMIQLSTHPIPGHTFPELLQACLREHPDTLLLSDLPDPETARLALQAARSGMRLLAGYPGDRAAYVPADLIAMGVSAYQVASSLAGILVQCRARRLCEACKQPDPQATFFRERLYSHYGIWDSPSGDAEYHTSGGCNACGYTGYSGHVNLFECLPVTASIRNAILHGASPDELPELAMREGMVTLATDGHRRVKMGELSLEELLRVLNI